MPVSNDRYLEVKDVSFQFGTLVAVKNVSFTLSRGEIAGIMGSDGAGKSTLLKMMANLYRPSHGEILIGGVNGMKARRNLKNLIGYMPQRFGLYSDLTVEENLDFFLDVFGIENPERNRRKEYYLHFAQLTPFTGRLARELSGGMRQKLGLIAVLIHEPEVLILDEPTIGLDPLSREEFWAMLKILQGKGKTIVIATSYLDEGARCDRLGIMHLGELLAFQTPDQIQGESPNLEEAIIALLQERERR